MNPLEASVAIVLCALCFGFFLGGMFESGPGIGGIWGLLFLLFAVLAGMMLVEDGPIRPLWLQYLVLGVAPFGVGLGLRYLLSRRSPGNGTSDDSAEGVGD